MLLQSQLATVVLDEDSVEAVKQLRLAADDFEVKSIIGRGHFGEVCVRTRTYVICV